MVLEGGSAIVTRIKTAVKQEPAVPVMLFKGIGGFTDILIYAMR